MRIAILTLALYNNFGGILQCFALQTVLRRLGHEVTVLKLSTKRIEWHVRLALFIKRLIKFLIKRESIFYGSMTEEEILSMNTQKFVRKHIYMRIVKDWSQLKENEYDAFVVGSDQVWRPMYFGNPITNAYLGFAKDWISIKRVAYAASFGTDEWEYTPKETTDCASLLRKFDAVSVRESSGVKLCKEHFGVNAVCLLDPTLLLTKNDYLSILEVANSPVHNGGLFYYILDETNEKMQFVQKIANQNNWKPYRANNCEAEKPVYFERRIQKPVEPWIAGFRDAQFVVTDSFHGCVFSILFNKSFVVIGNQKRGMARFYSLLSLFHLENRLISLEQLDDYKDSQIDWGMVNRILEQERVKAFDFLKSLA